MKKTFVILCLVFFSSVQAYAQAGDFYGGLQGGYITYYKAPLYGCNLSYTIFGPLQISLTGLMNPNVNKPAAYNKDVMEKLKLYSANLDARLFLINMESWATGPSLGVQYLHKGKTTFLTDGREESYADNLLGFNIGWHLKVNVTDNFRVNGGWRYSSIKDDDSYNLFYVGIGYAFNLL
ncbi:MAG: porin family protein [Tannerella sp.]|jgi:opacity protein-like surface antigen|nr:porin family protein [Tannerella sp.]